MANDKKDYEDTLRAMLDHSTTNTLINKLNKVFVATEDTDLRKLLAPVIRTFKEAATLQTKQVAGAVSVNDPRYRPLVDYCRQCINSVKPQWQIIAERHGWGPKRG